MANIKALREKANLTQQELAERLGVTQGAVSQWEAGIVFPRATMLPKLARELKTTVDKLLTA